MNLLLLTDGITPFTKGGMQRHSQLVAEYLARLGHKLCVFHCVGKDEIDSVIASKAFTEQAIPNIELKTFEYIDDGKLPGHYLRAQKKLSETYYQHFLDSGKEYDFIYTKGFTGWELLRRKAELKFKAPIGVKFHGMNMYQPQASFKLELQKYLIRPSTKTILNRSDYVFSYGGKITDIIEQHTNTPILEVPAGIEQEWVLNEMPRRTGVLKFLFVGRFDRVKGLPELYVALEKLSKHRQDWECHFVGPIPQDYQLKLPQCIYHGAVYDIDTLKTHYDLCDVLLNTSISEGMPNVVLEGMSRGLAIIATDVGATSILVKNGENGQLIHSPKPDLILEALTNALELKESKLMEMRSRSLERSKSFLWSAIGVKLEETIARCL